MSHFVSKRMTCVPETVFSGLMLAVSLFRREGDKASLQCFIFRVQIGTVGEGSVGMCWLAAEGRAGSLSLESLEVWVCNFMGFCFSIKHSSKSVPYWWQFVLTSACWPNDFCRWWARRKWLQPTSFTPTLDTQKRRLWGFPCFPTAAVSGQASCPAPVGVPCVGVLLPWVGQWPRSSSWSRSFWSCVGRVFLGFYGSFLLIIWVQLCLMS